MPKATANGKTFNFPQGTTPDQMGQAIDEYFSSQNPAPASAEEAPQDDRSIARKTFDTAVGAKDAVRTVVSGMAAEPIAGLAGLASAPFLGAESGDVVRKVRDFLTIEPKTEEGMRIMQEIADTIEPLTSRLAATEQSLGDKGYEMGGPLGGAIGATLPTAAMELLGVGAGKGAIRSAQNVRDVAKATPNAEAQQVLDAGKRLDVPVLNSDVNPPTSFIGKSAQQLSEKLGPLGSGSARTTQQAARKEVVETLANDFGVEINSPFAGQMVKSLNAEQARKMTEAADIRNQAVGKLNEYGPVPTTNTLSAIDRQIARQQRLGAKADQSIIKNLEDTKEALQGGDFSLVKDIRTEVIDDIKALRNSEDARGAASLQAVKSAMDNDLLSFAKSSDRRAAAQWVSSNRKFADAYGTAKQTELKRILEKGEVTPENVLPILRGGKPSELRRLKSSMNEDGVKAARAAVIKDVMDESGFFRGDTNPNRVATSLGKTKRQQAVDVFFDAEGKKELEGLRKLLDATRRAQDAAAAPATGVQSIPYLVGGGVGASGAAFGVIPTLAGASTLAGIAKAYESVPFRNLMLKLSNTKKGSRQETLILESAVPAALAGLQAAKARQEQTQPAPIQ